MEILVNCEIVVDMWLIDKISGGNREVEIFFTSDDKKKYMLYLEDVWDMRVAVENAFLAREFKRNVEQISSILLVENSEYIKYFERQVCGTYPTDELKHYILFDKIDTVIEVLMLKEPVLVKL